MAKIVGPGGAGAGPGGWKAWRFSHKILISWMDGQERILEAGVDYPEEMPFDALKKRIALSTYRQWGTSKIWLDAEGQVHVILKKDQW
jgi:hypothetical protein